MGEYIEGQMDGWMDGYVATQGERYSEVYV
jgi:hypothetical protein